MKKVLLVGLFGFLAQFQPAFADQPASPTPSPWTHYNEGAVMEWLNCHDVKHYSDWGYGVHLYYEMPILHTDGRRQSEPRLHADLTEMTIMGPRKLGNFVVRKKPGAAVGSPMLLIAPGFRMEINATVAPNEHGEIPAHLVAEVEGRRISEDMLCGRLR